LQSAVLSLILLLETLSYAIKYNELLPQKPRRNFMEVYKQPFQMETWCFVPPGS